MIASPSLIAAFALLACASPTLLRGDGTQPQPAADYRTMIETLHGLATSADSSQPQDLAHKADELLMSLQMIGDGWWKTHTAKDLPAASDDEILSMLSYCNTDRHAKRAVNQTAPIAEALTRPGFASVIDRWDWDSLKNVSDAQLQRLWQNSVNLRSAYSRPRNAEIMLVEMDRRGGQEFEKLIQNQLDQSDDHFGLDLPLFTALRRVQKKPDPIAVQLAQPAYEATFPQLPTISLALVNVDQRPVAMDTGGDYRSGRVVRWRMEVKDAQGKRMQWCNWTHGDGGGFKHTDTLNPGESRKGDLPLSNYIAPLPPGDYTLQAQYHYSTDDIADRDDVSDLLLLSTKEVKLTIKPLLLRNGQANRKLTEALIAKLPADGPTKIVDGTYGDWANDFVAPDSPQGQLLKMGLDALPALIDAANNKATTKPARATILGLLFSATHVNDPRSEPKVLGASDSRQGPWAINWGDGGGFGGIGKITIYAQPDAPKIDAASQLQLAARWRTWSQGIKVEEPSPNSTTKP